MVTIQNLTVAALSARFNAIAKILMVVAAAGYDVLPGFPQRLIESMQSREVRQAASAPAWGLGELRVQI
jgi:hypothetical protein